MNPDCFSNSEEQTKGEGLQEDAWRRRESRRMGGDRKVSGFTGAISV